MAGVTTNSQSRFAQQLLADLRSSMRRTLGHVTCGGRPITSPPVAAARRRTRRRAQLAGERARVVDIRCRSRVAVRSNSRHRPVERVPFGLERAPATRPAADAAAISSNNGPAARRATRTTHRDVAQARLGEQMLSRRQRGQRGAQTLGLIAQRLIGGEFVAAAERLRIGERRVERRYRLRFRQAQIVGAQAGRVMRRARRTRPQPRRARRVNRPSGHTTTTSSICSMQPANTISA